MPKPNILPDNQGVCYELDTLVEVYGSGGAAKFGYSCELLPDRDFSCVLWTEKDKTIDTEVSGD